MRDRIYKHLEQAGEAQPADHLLRDALSIRSPSRRAAETIVRAIVGSDGRFARTPAGLWKIAARQVPGGDPASAAALFLESSARGAASQLVRAAVWIPESGRGWDLVVCAEISAEARSALAAAHAATAGRPLVVWSSAEFRLWRRIAVHAGLTPPDEETIALRPLAACVLERAERRITPADLAAPLGLPQPDPERPEAMARFLASALAALVERVPAGHRSAAGIAVWIDAGRAKVDFSRFGFGHELLEKLPATSGVYLFRDRAGRAFYVGKARSLASRVRSYFQPRALADPKIDRIHRELHTVEWIETESEVEALMLEMKLIRDLEPAVNLQSEVHEREAPYGKERNLILLVPDARSEAARAYLLRRGLFARSMRAGLGRAPSRALREAVRKTYFGAGPERPRDARELQIVARWLAANRRRTNVIDVDEAGGFTEVIRILEAYLRDPDRLSRKVYYR